MPTTADNDMHTILTGFISDYGAKATVKALTEALKDAGDNEEDPNGIAAILAKRMEDVCR